MEKLKNVGVVSLPWVPSSGQRWRGVRPGYVRALIERLANNIQREPLRLLDVVHGVLLVDFLRALGVRRRDGEGMRFMFDRRKYVPHNVDTQWLKTSSKNAPKTAEQVGSPDASVTLPLPIPAHTSRRTTPCSYARPILPRSARCR